MRPLRRDTLAARPALADVWEYAVSSADWSGDIALAVCRIPSPVNDSLEQWFSEVDLGQDPTPAATAVMAQLAKALNHLRPASLDRHRSTICASGHGWLMDNSVVAHLAHASEPDSDVDIVVGDREAIISWSTAHEHVYPEDGDRQRPWTTVVIDAVAAILRGEYLIEEHWRGERLIKVRLIDKAGSDERHLSTTGSLLGWLPSRRPDRIERRVVSFDAHT